MDKNTVKVVLDALISLGECAKRLKTQGHLTVKDVRDAANEFCKSVKGTEIEDIKLININIKEKESKE